MNSYEGDGYIFRGWAGFYVDLDPGRWAACLQVKHVKLKWEQSEGHAENTT